MDYRRQMEISPHYITTTLHVLYQITPPKSSQPKLNNNNNNNNTNDMLQYDKLQA